MKETKKKEFIIGIIHKHRDDYGTSIGKIKANARDEALKLSEFWLAKKKKEHNCKKYGDNCFVDVRAPKPSMKSVMLSCGAEIIDSVSSKTN